MSYILSTVTNNQTEADFVWSFIQSFTGRDSRIVCTETKESIDTKFNGNQAPEFSFVVSEIVTIKFKKISASQGGNTARYTVSFVYGSINFAYTVEIAGSSLSVETIAARTIKYQIVSNDKLIFIRFGNYNSTMPLTTNYTALIYSDNSNNFLASASNGTYYVGTDNIAAKKITRLPYIKNINDVTQIEVIKSCILVAEGSDEEVLEINGLWDATTNYTTNVPLKIGTEECCFLDNNTVMKYKEETEE